MTNEPGVLTISESTFQSGTLWADSKSKFSGSIKLAGIHLEFMKLHANAVIPTKAHKDDLGYDLYALEETVIHPEVVTKIRTGIAIGFPTGCGGFIKDRSSIATKLELFTVAGVIDNGYTGEIIVAMFNPDIESAMIFSAGDKIAQLVLIPVVNVETRVVDTLTGTDRGAGGFGSTGSR